MTLLVNESVIGKTVTFSSKNPVDPTVYKGIITGLITYNLAGRFGFDLVSYNTAVQRADSTVGDISTLNYFVITLTNDQPLPNDRVFTDEWISSGSFSVIQSATIYNFNIYDLPANGESAIITLLRANGYNAVLVINPSAVALNQGRTTISG